MQIDVTVQDANNILCEVTPPQPQIIVIDRGVEGNGIVSIVPVTISTFQYLRITYTNGTVQDVGPLTSTAYTATAPITIVGNTISLATVPIASGGTDATTAAGAIQNLLPSYTGNANKRLGLNSLGTALEWVLDGGGTVTSVAASGGTTGLTFTGSPITTSGTLTLGGTLAVANGGTGVTSSTGTGSVVLSTSPTLVTPVLGTPTSGNFSTGTFTWPTFNQNTTGTAANITATSNSTLTTLSALSLPGSQVNGNISGNAANVTGVVAIANGGTGQITANAALNALLPTQTGNASKYLQTDGTNATWDAISLSTADITGILPTANGGTGLSSFTANGVVYASSSSALTTGSALTFDGTTFGLPTLVTSGTANIGANLYLTANALYYHARTTGGTNVRMLGINAGNTAYVGPIDSGPNDTILNASASSANIQFYASGSEQMRLTNTGLGIGVTSPAFKLDVGGQDGTNIALRSTGTSAARFRAYVNSAESGVIGFLNGGGQFFEVAGTEQMRLTSTGLGIGTSSPATKLHVSGAFGSQLRLQETSGTFFDIAVGGRFDIRNNAGTTIVSIAQSGAPAGTQLNLDTSGNLGLGVVPSAWGNPLSKALEFNNGCYVTAYNTSGTDSIYVGANNYYNGTNYIYKNSRAATQYQQVSGTHLWFTAASGTAGNAITFTQAMTLTAGGKLFVNTTSGFIGVSNVKVDVGGRYNSGISGVGSYSFGAADGGGAFVINDTSNGSTEVERMRINSSGNVGIGQTSPAYKLDVFGTTPAIRLIANGVSNGVKLEQSSATGDVELNVIDGYALKFATSNTERARIDSSGNFGIGTSSPTQKLHVENGNVLVRGSSIATSFTATSNQNTAYTTSFTTNWDENILLISAAGRKVIEVGGYTAADSLRLFTGNSERARIDSSGNLMVGGTTNDGRRLTIMGNTNDLSGIGITYVGVAASSIAVNSSGALTLNLNNSDGKTERARITASGDFGIGTTSTAGKLDVLGSSNRFIVNPYYFAVFSGGMSSYTKRLFGGAVVDDFAYIGDMYYENSGTWKTPQTSYAATTFGGGVTTFYGGTGVTANTAFYPIERARITSDGVFYMNRTTTNSYDTNIWLQCNISSWLIVNNHTFSTQYFNVFRYNGTSIGSIIGNGTSTTYATSSDYRLKENIAPMTGALAKVAQLKPCTYTWKSNGSSGEGFIAHELAEVMPQAVTGEKDAVDENGNPDYQGIDTSFLVATLTAAIQELKAEFDAYKASHP